MLLLQEFDVEIRDKKDICNFLVAFTYPLGASKAVKERLESDAKYYYMVNLGHSSQGHIILVFSIYSIHPRNLIRGISCALSIRRCILESEIQSVLHFYHLAVGGGHYGSDQTAQSVLDYGLYWPTIFRDAHTFVSAYGV
ncbi:hypothetical protein CR513_52231, partial [Mucuna pruriens]